MFRAWAWCLFCESQVAIKRHHDEYTEEERAQQLKNKQTEKAEDWAELSYDEREQRGYLPVPTYLSNYARKSDGTCHDPLIEPLAERIKDHALDPLEN